MAHTDTWDATFKATPADGDQASQGDDQMRIIKRAVEERLALDHSMAGDDDDGLHKWASFMEQSADPANIANIGRLYTKDVAGITELFYIDDAGTLQQLTSNGAISGLSNFPDLSGYGAGQVVARNAAGDGNVAYATPDHIAGLIPTLNGTDTAHDIDIPAGEAVDTTQGARLIGTAMTKRIDEPFAEGTNAGLMTPIIVQTGTFTTSGVAVTGESGVSQFLTEFSVGDILYSSTEIIGRRITVITDDEDITLESAFGTAVGGGGDPVQKGGLAPNTTYYIHIKHKTADGTIDYYCDTSQVAANIHTDWALYQELGQFETDSSANIISTSTRRKAISRIIIPHDFISESGAKIIIEKRTVTSSIVENEFSWTSGVYSDIIIRVDNLFCTTGSDAELRLQLSTDAGASYLTANYAHTVSAETGFFTLTNDLLIENTSSPQGFSGNIILHAIDDTVNYRRVTLDSYFYASTAAHIDIEQKGYNTSTSEITGFKILGNDGGARNTASAVFSVWGILR